MRIHSSEKINRLKELRRAGYSINELVRELSIPKTTVWHHVNNIIIAPEYLSILKSKRGGSSILKQKNIELSKKIADDLLNSSKREHVLALTMLYWAEGSKKEAVFTNSDGRMIDLYIKIMIKMFNIPKDRIIPTIRIFTGMNKEECLEYWSKIIGLPKNKFFVRLNDGGTKSKVRYGICRLIIKKGSNNLKLMHSLIEQCYKELVESA